MLRMGFWGIFRLVYIPKTTLDDSSRLDLRTTGKPLRDISCPSKKESHSTRNRRSALQEGLGVLGFRG